jgi:eukaryotic-like serine/threonine-protein kinase
LPTADRLSNALQGRYAIKRELGSGGMATVYVAHDVRHDRDVAVKVLHPDLGAVLGGERFLTEIKTTARLQHPHILPLLDSGEADGLLFYVMPLVEGQTLRQKLERERQLPIDEALRIATEVASALDYAHRHNVIHRDIKPENILLHDGRAVVADFGIALAVTAASGTRMTQTGLSLGTPQYMAPEQAMGERVIDSRADVYALGAVTYEMLTGEPPFSGATVQAIVAKVLTEKPMSLTAIRDSAPRHVEATINKALAKLPADRFATAAQFAEALARPQLTTELPSTGPAASAEREGWRRHVSATPLIWGGLAGAVILAAGGWLRARTSESPPAPVVRFTMEPGPQTSLAPGPSLTISNDGSRIAFVGLDSARRRHIFVRSLDRLDPVRLPGTLNANSPFFSPSGDSLGFVRDSKLHALPLRGGYAAAIADVQFGNFTATWGDDGTIIFGQNGNLYRVSASGGTPTLIASGRLLRPHFLPGARALLAVRTDGGTSDIVTIQLGDTAVTLLQRDGEYPHYVDDGAVVFGRRDGTIHAVGFDAMRLRTIGAPEMITDKAVTTAQTISRFGAARNGSIVLLFGSSAYGRSLVVVDRSGATKARLTEERQYRYPRFSPTGADLAFHVELRGGMLGDIWTYSLSNRGLLRLTFDSVSAQPEWDPDGKSLVYVNSRTSATSRDLNRIFVDGSKAPSPVLDRERSIFESRITPDRRWIIFREDVNTSNRDILMARLDSPPVVVPLLTTSADEKGFALSPDGKWLAYVSNETGIDEVYVRRLQENSARWPVSRGGGTEARWARNEIFYRAGDSTMVATITLGNEPVVGVPRFLFSGSYAAAGYEPLWDVSPDGSRFAFVVNRDFGGAPIGVVLNWTANWKARRKQ